MAAARAKRGRLCSERARVERREKRRRDRRNLPPFPSRRLQARWGVEGTPAFHSLGPATAPGVSRWSKAANRPFVRQQHPREEKAAAAAAVPRSVLRRVGEAAAARAETKPRLRLTLRGCGGGSSPAGCLRAGSREEEEEEGGGWQPSVQVRPTPARRVAASPPSLPSLPCPAPYGRLGRRAVVGKTPPAAPSRASSSSSAGFRSTKPASPPASPSPDAGGGDARGLKHELRRRQGDGGGCDSLRLLPEPFGAHRLGRESQLPPTEEFGRQSHLARRAKPKDSRRETRQAPSATRDRELPEPDLRTLWNLPHQSYLREPYQTSGAMDSAGCLQMAEEALPTQLSHLRGGLLTPRHHRSGPLAVERGEAAAHGDYPGVSATGSAPTGAAASGAGGSPQLTASQSRDQLSSG